VPDQEQVRLEHPVGRRHLGQERVSGVRSGSRRDEPDAKRDPVDMGVDGHHRDVQAEEQDAGGRLGTDSGERHQPPHRLVRRHTAQPLEVEPVKVAQCGLDAGRLLDGQPAGAERLDELGLGSVPDVLPGREPLPHAGVGVLAVSVARVLAQDRQHELVQGGPSRAQDGLPIRRLEAVHDLGHRHTGGSTRTASG